MNDDPFAWVTALAGVDVGVTQAGRFTSVGGNPACPPGSDGPQLPPRGVGEQEIVLARMIFPPRIEKLAVSVDFNVNSYTLTLPAGVGSTVLLPGFQVPQGQVGWLQQWFLYTLAPTAATQASWQIRINGAPVPGYDNNLNPPGIANLLVDGDDDMRIRLGGGVRVDILITNIGGTAETVGAGLRGWYHPEAAEWRAFGNANTI